MATGRSRGLRKQLSSEDQALNMIAKEAEARLAAKRAARAEARSIRMKELEKKQREIDDTGVDDVDTPSRRTSSLMSSPAAAPSPTGSESNLSSATLDTFKDTLKETEDKYRKAMVNSAQLDNEKQALLYQVECLKDFIEDMEESLHNVRDELTDKTKELVKLSRESEKTTEKLQKTTVTLKDRERILDEHGINHDGTLREDNDEADGTSHDTTHDTNHVDHIQQDVEDRESLLSEIESLKNEVAELKSQQDTISSRKSTETVRTAERGDRADLERSFVDVSPEAAAIQEENTQSTLYINNNEKCDEFEVIDNGSQQGGLRNFEDKSFERSGRSSLLSSVVTVDGGVTDSMESELPLEISLDKSQQASNRDDYDIVQLDDEPSKSRTILNIKSMTENNFRAPSPAPASDINIDKYLFNDAHHEEHDDEPVTSSSFNIDLYYCDEQKNGDGDADQSQLQDVQNTDKSNKFDDNVDTFTNEKRGSPFLQVQSESTSDTTPTSDPPVDKSDPDGASSPIQVISETENEDVELNSDEIVTDNVGEAVESALPATDVETVQPLDNLDKPDVISSGKFSEQDQPPTSPSSSANQHLAIASVEKEDIRKSVEDLYEKIAFETGSDEQGQDGLPANATFGVFGIAGNVNRDKEDLERSSELTDASTDSNTVDKSDKWLVRVESFSTAAKKTPEIKVIETDPKKHQQLHSLGSSEDGIVEGREETPVPKARAKKKKKKGKVDKTSVQQEKPSNSPSPPDSQQDSETTTPLDSPTKKVDHSDIPKQFLDASSHLAAGDSLSDVSDVEHGEAGEDEGASGSTINKKRGSKKGKAKDQSCKTQ